VRVFGLDPVADPPAVLRRIGYLSEEREPARLDARGRTASLHAGVLPGLGRDLRRGAARGVRAGPAQKVKTLSRGQRAQLALLLPWPTGPSCCCLTSPPRGSIRSCGATFSRPLSARSPTKGARSSFPRTCSRKVERVADTIAMIHAGRLVLSGPIEEIKEAHRRLTLALSRAAGREARAAGHARLRGEGREWSVLCNGGGEALRGAAAALGAVVIEERTPSLEEIFVARVKG